ncbi:response regulator transcription factor [Flavihumibacter sp. UBA7668]|uniref:response regulator n=1 Tax=Flavihumibacter sp. UBA7668 TaxID=1946542 RepID=UPI0025BCC35B|nr:response regulator transcription factor [Flavihumibacter sp. UBA7668]
MNNEQPANLQIAMIDDHNLLRNGLAKIINEFDGFEVSIQANNGREFIDLMSTRKKPDIVLLDINMPVMNGYETAKWINSHLPGTKMLVLSMLDTDYAFIRMIRLGARGFMIKDSHPEQFYRALVQLRDEGFYMNEILTPRMANRLKADHSQDTGITQDGQPNLSAKEIEFLKLACTEMTYREIAAAMGISIRTVDSYRDVLFDKLAVTTRIGLVLYAIKNGIVMI